MSHLHEFLAARRGNLSVVTALLSVPLIAAGGLALTYSFASLERSKAQNALDAAVLAGTSLGYSASDAARLAAAYTLTGIAPTTLDAEAEYEITVGSTTLAFATHGTTVQGYVVITLPNPFSRFVGDDYLSIHLDARAEKQSSKPVCMLALNDRRSNSIHVYGTSTVQAPNCAVMANSTSPSAIKQQGNAEIAALEIGVTGSADGAKIAPVPIADVEPMADWYAGLPIPRPGPCVDVSGRLSKAKFSLSPGTYCGGLSISPLAEVHLQPGVYIMKDGALELNANSILTGEEVVIAFVGPGSTLVSNAGSIISLTSPKSGIYANIQFISDRKTHVSSSDTDVFEISNTTLTYDGVMYLPEMEVWLRGDTQVRAKSPTFSMIADRFRIQDTSDVRLSHENAREIDLDFAGLGFKFGAKLVQ